MAAYTVTTSALLIAETTAGAGSPAEVIITNDSGVTVYLGNSSSVTTSTGIALPTASSIGMQLIAPRKVYAIAASGSNNVRAEVWE